MSKLKKMTYLTGLRDVLQFHWRVEKGCTMKRKKIVNRKELVRAYKVFGDFLGLPAQLHEAENAGRSKGGKASCSRTDFVRLAATFERPFTQKDMEDLLDNRGFYYRASNPGDAIRTRLYKDPYFKSHQTNRTIPKGHFVLDRKIAKLALA